MPLQYKINCIELLKEKGYNSTLILKEGIISQSAMQCLRENKMIGTKTLCRLCELLELQPGDIIEYVDDKK